jgi:phosphate-selective porin OprO/OprP
LALTAQAQRETDEAAFLAPTNSLSFRAADSSFLITMRFRMQNRASFFSTSGDNLHLDDVDARIRRLRLRLDGFVLSPKVRYYIQLSFSRADLDLESETTPQVVRDAIVYYYVNENLYFGFGQTKLPGNRQRVTSSGNLQFAERSIANARFNIDRDFGLKGYYTSPGERNNIVLKGSISTGDGRNALVSDNGLSYTGRVEWLPLGLFPDDYDYVEGDPDRIKVPRLALAGTYSANFKARQVGGQLGLDLTRPVDIRTAFADMTFKYLGWALLAEYFWRDASQQGLLEVNPDGQSLYVYTGRGLNVQASRLLSRRDELAARYALTTPFAALRPLERQREELVLGWTHYLNDHRFKWQVNVGYLVADGVYHLSHPGNRWNTTIQVEIGI